MLQGFVEVVSNNWNEKGGQGTLKGPRRGERRPKSLPLLLFGEKVEGKSGKFLPFFTNLSICSPVVVLFYFIQLDAKKMREELGGWFPQKQIFNSGTISAGSTAEQNQHYELLKIKGNLPKSMSSTSCTIIKQLNIEF